jgi:hypothetical protein
MASLIFNSLARDILLGNVSFGADSFRMMLVGAGYVPDKDAHAKRADVTDEVTGAGYAAGGLPVAVTVGAVDAANDRVGVSFGDVSWGPATITARGAVIYKARGGAASADELVAYVDFGGNEVATSGTFVVQITSPFWILN